MTYEYEILACTIPGHLISISAELSRIEVVKENPLAMWMRIGYIRASKELGKEEVERIVDVLKGKQKQLSQKVHGVIRGFQLRQLQAAQKEEGDVEK